MSVTLPSVRSRIRVMLKEADARTQNKLGLIEVDNGIRNAYTTLQAKLPAIESETASAGTISAGSDTFTLPTTSSAEYRGLVWIKLRSTGEFLTFVDGPEMNALTDGNATVQLDVPRYFTLWEDASQVIQGRCSPGALAAEAYDLHRTLVASDFDLTAVDSTTLALSRIGIQALIYQAAAELAATLTDEDLKLRRLNPNVVRLWLETAAVLIHQESIRLYNIASTGRTQRWRA